MTNQYLREFILGAGLWLVLLLTAWVYWPGLSGPSLLDDGANLRVLSILDENAGYFSDVVEMNRSGPLGRPVSMLSFSFSRFVYGENIWGFKFHNLVLHLVSGAMLCWFLVLVGQWKGAKTPGYIAVLVSMLWLLSPLSVSTVLYPVQRMAQLAVLFTFSGLVSYLKWRRHLFSDIWGWFYFLAMIGCVVLAVFSKENGALLMPLIVVTEAWICAYSFNDQRIRSSARALVRYLVIPSAAILLFVFGWYSADGYGHRDFSLFERLATQLSILPHYLSQIVFPDIRSMGIYQDDWIVSRSMGWSEVLSLLVIAFFLLTSICVKREKWILPYWAVLFFLVSHLVESTVIPLELYFEHRNYMGLFAPVFLIAVLAFDRKYSWVTNFAAQLWLLAALVLFPLLSSALVMNWSTKELISYHAYEGHPRSARANSDLSILYVKWGDLDRALSYSQVVSNLKSESTYEHALRDLSLSCLAQRENTEPYVTRINPTASEVIEGRAGEILYKIALDIQNKRCGAFDSAYVLAELQKRILEREFLAPEKAFASLAIIASAIGQYGTGEAIVLKWLERSTERRAIPLMMGAYFALRGGNLEQAAVWLDQLEHLESISELTAYQVDDYNMFQQWYVRLLKQRGKNR